jgi:hypothetical protein
MSIPEMKRLHPLDGGHHAANLRSMAPNDFQKLLTTPGPPELGPSPRPDVLSIAELNAELARLLEKTELPEASHLLTRAIVFLWHDHLEEAHSISQEIETKDGSYVHGIIHRREPDYGNARYWFNRVGFHDCFTTLATRARAIATAELQRRLIKSKAWDPFGFIDACETATKKKVPEEIHALRAIQGEELRLLLQHCLASC